MRWMGGWSYAALSDAPDDYIDRIAEMMAEEAERARR